MLEAACEVEINNNQDTKRVHQRLLFYVIHPLKTTHLIFYIDTSNNPYEYCPCY